MHDSQLFKNTRLYQQLSEGEIFPNKCLHLGHFEEIPLVIIRGSTFPQHCCLLKAYKEDTKVDKVSYLNKVTFDFGKSSKKRFFRKCLITVQRTHFHVMFSYDTCLIISLYVVNTIQATERCFTE